MTDQEKAIRERLAHPMFDHMREAAATSLDAGNSAMAAHRLLALLDAERAHAVQLEGAISAFVDVAERAVANARSDHKGMHVPYFDDFANINPSVTRNLEWWARKFREAMGGQVTAREEGRAWAERMWAKCSVEERACQWFVIGSTADGSGAKWRAATDRWRELQSGMV